MGKTTRVLFFVLIAVLLSGADVDGWQNGGFQIAGGILRLGETTTPAALADHGTLYTQSDNILYFQDGDGAAHALGGTMLTFKSYSLHSASLGTYWTAGGYSAPLEDVDLTQASTTQNYGAATLGYGAHAFAVASGAGSVDAGTVSVVVSGTSIGNDGTRTTSDSEVLIADITAANMNEYFETTKKWLGQIVYTLTPAGASTYSFTFNYGLAAYDNLGCRNFRVSDFECTGLGEASDNIDIVLLHHKATGWTYHATTFVPGNSAIVSFAADYSTDNGIDADERFKYKRSALTTDVNGNDHEGYIIKVVTGTNNSIGYLNCHVGAIL